MLSPLGRAAPRGAALGSASRRLATVATATAPAPSFPPPPTALRVLYVDAALLVADKPPGLLSVPGRTPRSEVANAHALLAGWALQRQPADAARLLARASAFAAVEQLRAAEAQLAALEAATAGDGPTPPSPTRYVSLRWGRLRWTADLAAGAPFPSPLGLHRLDEATSGLLAFGLTYPMQRALALQLQPGGAARKVYEAVVDTRAAEAAAVAAGGAASDVSPLMTADEGVVDTPLRRHNHLPLLQVRDGGGGEGDVGGSDDSAPFSPSARVCITRWRVLARGSGAVRVELTPLTGRTHQLRLHCALPPPFGLGAPVVGDPFYGDPALAESPYLLELLARAAERRRQQQQHHAGDGDAAAATDAFATSAELLAREHAARSALLARAGWERRMPALDGCAYLPPHTGGSSAASLLRPVPRLLLHARELHVADAFSHADRVLTRARWAAEGGGPHRSGSPRYRATRRAGDSSNGAAAVAAVDDGADTGNGADADSPAVATARRAGASLWAQAAPWTVEDCTTAASDGSPSSSPFVRRYEVTSLERLQSNAAVSMMGEGSKVAIEKRGKRRHGAPPPLPATAFVAFTSPTPF